MSYRKLRRIKGGREREGREKKEEKLAERWR